jgi:glycosyltransferase involved in cell wall biosynthesis
MRVAVLSHTYVERENRKKLYAVAEQSVDVTLYAPERWREGELGREWHVTAETDHNVRVVPLTVRRPIQSPAAAWWGLGPLQDALAARRHDLVHVEEEPWSLVSRGAVRAAGRAGVPATMFTWNNLPHHPPWPLSRVARAVAPRYDGWVAGNRAAADLLRRLSSDKPLLVLPQLGIDRPTQRAQRAESHDGIAVGYVGRLVPEKGVSDLIDALAQTRAPWRLALVGAGPARSDLERQAHQLGVAQRVAFRGAVPHDAVQEILRQLDVLVLPSHTTPRWAEQFGHVLLEAMAAGAVVVGSDSGAIPEVIGEAGMVFPEGDVAALADALTTLASDPNARERLRTAGCARAEAYSHAQVAQRLIAFWQQVTSALTLSA